MSPLVISIAVFVCVAALVASLAMALRERSDSKTENRLDLLASAKQPTGKDIFKESVLTRPLDTNSGFLESLLPRRDALQKLLEQADTSLTATNFLLVSVGMCAAGFFVALAARMSVTLAPFAAAVAGALPLLWLVWRKKRRMKLFGKQLPEALELIARALRAGHSLGAGFHLVQEEMTAPVGTEFGRVFEEQNLGIPMDEALGSLSERIPNLDLKFFCTAVVLQRQTGGDLAEILDKIGHLVRERFQIWGQIQALTGEGRLSGIVLLALPPVLFLAVYRLNPNYVMMLFTDPMGKKMLLVAVVMQLLGALWIRKIINIKV